MSLEPPDCCDRFALAVSANHPAEATMTRKPAPAMINDWVNDANMTTPPMTNSTAAINKV